MSNREDSRQKEYQTLLENLLKEPANKKCADCGAPAPRWASASLGIFICMRCAGIHRNVGVHVTFVRSVTLDKWNEEQVQNMMKTGNARAADLYEARIPAGYPRPNPADGSAIERWIRDKYERKRFMGEPLKPSSRSSPANEFGAYAKPSVNPSRATVISAPLPHTPTAPTPKPAPPLASLLLPTQPQAQPQIQPQAPVQMPTAPVQMPSQPILSQPVQAIKIPTAEEQAAAKKANVLQIFEQQSQLEQQQLQQQMQLQQQLHYQHQLQQQQALYAAYAQAAYLQHQQIGVGNQQQPLFYAYQPNSGNSVAVAGTPDPLLQKINAMAHEKRQSEFGTLFG